MASPSPQPSPGATVGQSESRTSIISRRMTAAEVVSHLITHECNDLSSIIDPSTFGDYPISQGGFSDIYRGRLLDASRSQVAIKALRIDSVNPDPEHLKHAARELHTWNKCKHPNIVPLLGLTLFRDRIGMVSPWMEKGSLLRYLQKTPDADRHDLCVQICEGLSYLHQIGITHGDLKGGNVLVSEKGIPALTDFGNSILADSTMKLTQGDGQTTGTAVTLRWSAAELIEGKTLHTKASDIYALGMTILEVISGRMPYYGKSDTTVMFLVVLKKEFPERPGNMPNGEIDADKIWGLLLRCWSHEPGARPSANEVTTIMKQAHISVSIARQMPLNDIALQLEFQGCENLTSLLDFTGESDPTLTNNFAKVRTGTLIDGRRVALKFRRQALDIEDEMQNKKHAAHEIYVMSKCNHPNILGLLGFALYQDRLAIVSPWALHGPLPLYISRNNNANRCSLSVQIASAVTYLHGRSIVHGSIKGASVFITEDHTAVLGEFGFATMKNSTPPFIAAASIPAAYITWAAPETIDGSSGPTIQADVYSLGMTILECITGIPAYARFSRVQAMAAIMGGTYPGRPLAHIPNNEHGNRLWALLTRCWSRDVLRRPTAAEVKRKLSSITREGLLAGSIDATESWCNNQ